MDYVTHYDSPVGGITMISDGHALTGLYFEGQKYPEESIYKDAAVKEIPVFKETRNWLDTYFRGMDPGNPPEMKLRGTAFRESVWKILLTIPYGCTVTYGEIATRIAEERGIPRMSAQAVGGAVGHNPVSIIVPCHRVIGSDGNLTGYAGGIDRKKRLLELEKNK